jgi:hypothetical protein
MKKFCLILVMLMLGLTIFIGPVMAHPDCLDWKWIDTGSHWEEKWFSDPCGGGHAECVWVARGYWKEVWVHKPHPEPYPYRRPLRSYPPPPPPWCR